MENFDVDDLIVKMMAKGKKQQEVSDELKRLGITPNSLSIIEKKLRQMREFHKAKTIVHLFVILKNKKII